MKNNIKGIDFKALVVFLIFFIIVILVISGLIARNEIVEIAKSPNHQYEAIASLRSAGATTGFSPQVAIVNNYNPLKYLYRYLLGGNVFIAHGINGPYGSEYLKDHISVEWIDNKTIIISHSNREDEISKEKTKYWNIEIIYK